MPHVATKTPTRGSLDERPRRSRSECRPSECLLLPLGPVKPDRSARHEGPGSASCIATGPAFARHALGNARGDPRHLHRQRRRALHRSGPPVDSERDPVGDRHLHADVRRRAHARWPHRGPLRLPQHVPARNGGVHLRLPDGRPRTNHARAPRRSSDSGVSALRS